MNRTLVGLVVAVAAMGAQVARADDFDDGSDYHPSVPAQTRGHRRCGARPGWAPQGQTMQQGQYQLQNVQRWVPGVQQQVWVPGECRDNGGGWRHGRGRWGRQQQCSQGHYTTVTTPGHYETTQEWVWVSNGDPQQQQYGGGYQYQHSRGTFSVSVY